MEKKGTLFSSSLKFGLIIAIALILVTLIFYSLDQSTSKAAQYIGYAIMVGGIIWGMISYRDTVIEGKLTYSGGLGFGTMTSLVVALILAVFTYIYMAYINPELIQAMLEMAEEKMIEQGKDDEIIETALKWQAKFMSPPFMAGMSVLANFFLGFIISLITAAFVKNN